MRMVIVDDEPLARERLRRMVEEFPGWEVVGEAEDGESALALIRAEQPDVALLDVRMPGTDGLQVARELMDDDTPPAVIFTTAFGEHALSAFDSSATAYLLKPIRKEKLAEALRRARQPKRAQLDALEQLGQEQPTRSHILAHTRDGQVRIPISEVVYFMADQKYTTVHHLHGEVLIEESLTSLEQDLGSAFMRVHRKALAQVRFMQKLERDVEGHHNLRMRHADTLLPIGRRRLAELRRILSQGT